MRRREIRILADDVINQIAAGEVIERPSSVVKELCENGVDAGAERIAIEIDDGGRSLIRVVDDGVGMAPHEIRLALIRHATSKLTSAAEIYELNTMGFRGEALPSIAAVSRLEVISRQRGDSRPAGAALRVEAGVVMGEREVAAPPGTSVTVAELLFNLPARQKFMRSAATETGHIVDVVTKLSLAHPTVQFRLRAQASGRVLFEVGPSSSILERARALLAGKGPVRIGEANGGGFEVAVLTWGEGPSSRGARGVELFVNRRPVRDRGMLAAIGEASRERFGSPRYPQAMVFANVAPSQVDVNVHPQKSEVRFADPQVAFAVVKGATLRALAPDPGTRRGPADLLPHGAVSESPATAAPTRAAERLAHYAASRRAPPRFASNGSEQALPVPRSRPPTEGQPAPIAIADGSGPRRRQGGERAFFATLRLIGEASPYLICQAETELVFIDVEHAARLLAASRLREAARRGDAPSQRTLFPVRVEAAAGIVAAARADLVKLGFAIDDSDAVLAVPAGLAAESGARVAAAAAVATSFEGRVEIVASALSREPIAPAALLRQLDAVATPSHPLVLVLPLAELGARLAPTGDRG